MKSRKEYIKWMESTASDEIELSWMYATNWIDYEIMEDLKYLYLNILSL